MESILLQFLILINATNQARTGGVLWIFTRKKIFYLGLNGFKFFIVNNDESIINELLYNFKKCKVSLTNQKLTLCTMKFSIDSWEKLAHTKKEQLTDTAQNFFHLLAEFSKLKNTNDMNILILEHSVQELTSSTCWSFQLYLIQKKKVKLLITKLWIKNCRSNIKWNIY